MSIELQEKFFGLALLLILIFGINFWIMKKGFRIQLEREKLLNYNTAIVSNLIDPVVTTDLDYNIVSWNKNAEMVFGFSIREVEGKQLSRALQTKSLSYTLEEIRDFIKNQGFWNGDLIYHKKSGERVYMNVSTSLLRDEKNIPYGTVSILRDISIYENTLHQAQKELEFLNERLSLILRSTNEAIWDWNLTNNNIWGNEQYKSLIGFENYDEANNYNIFTSRMHPDYQGDKAFENTIKEKGESLSVELKYLMPSGEWNTFLNRIIILYDKGEPYRVLGSLQDITIRKKFEEQIIHEKELSDTLINSLPGVFYMFNKEGKYLRWNKNIEKITGYTADEMKDLHPIVFVPEEQRSMLAEKIANVFNYGVDNAEAGLLTKNQIVIPYYFTGIYVNYNGEDCMMGVGIDISERNKIQEELRELASHLQIIREEERSRIAREIHDELGQQLTGIKFDLSWLKKKLHDSPLDILNKLKDAMVTMDDTMKKVRQIATQLRPSVLDDLGLIAAMEWQSYEFQKRFDIKTEFISVDATIAVPADIATALFRVYQESLTNVLRHAAAKQVTTVLTIDNNNLILEISDNGIGFEMSEIENKKTLGITGIRERTIMMRGNFHMESQKGKGTRLTIQVPLIS